MDLQCFTYCNVCNSDYCLGVVYYVMVSLDLVLSFAEVSLILRSVFICFLYKSYDRERNACAGNSLLTNMRASARTRMLNRLAHVAVFYWKEKI